MALGAFRVGVVSDMVVFLGHASIRDKKSMVIEGLNAKEDSEAIGWPKSIKCVNWPLFVWNCRAKC